MSLGPHIKHWPRDEIYNLHHPNKANFFATVEKQALAACVLSMFTNNRYIVALFLLALILRLAYLSQKSAMHSTFTPLFSMLKSTTI